jgi:cardiolipin synthase
MHHKRISDKAPCIKGLCVSNPSALNIPNVISIARLMAVPVIVLLLIENQWLYAFWLFILAGISDGIDGFIARYFNQKTTLGAYLDPIADKILLVSLFIVLALQANIPLWLGVLVVTRDILIVGAFILSWMLDAALEVKPIFVSKANTFAQLLLVGLILLDLAYGFIDQIFIGGLVFVVGSLTLMSALIYTLHWLRYMAGLDDE